MTAKSIQTNEGSRPEIAKPESPAEIERRDHRIDQLVDRADEKTGHRPSAGRRPLFGS
jgi:hypothetical protein